VVGRDAVDRAVGQPLAQRLDVGLGAQRRVDLEDRVVAAGQVVGEHQVVRGDLGRDVPALALGPADELDAAGGADVADVQPAADVRGEQAVAGDDRLLGDGRPAGHAEQAAVDALVHLRADRSAAAPGRAGR
jgi:hypothetical protein